MTRDYGKSRFSAMAAVATVSRGGSVTYHCTDKTQAELMVRRVAKDRGVPIVVVPFNEGIRISPMPGSLPAGPPGKGSR